MIILVASLAVLLGGGVLALFVSNRPALATAIGAAGAVTACPLALVPVLRVLFGGSLAPLEIRGAAPLGTVVLGMDALSAFFLVPLLLLATLCAIYGRSYLLAYANRRWLGPPTLWFNVLVAAMMLVLMARSALPFLVAWEAMTLASFFLVTFDHGEHTVRRAGWVYLIAAHVGILCLLAMFLLLERHAGALTFDAFLAMPRATGGFGVLIFTLSVIGFGVKAGFVPLHVWLPEAHAAAPSHVSALMSGVLIKVGLYGLLRTLTFLPPANYWGPTFMVLGLVGALVGISLALQQQDIKRMLAYSSIENMGIIMLGLGLAFRTMSEGNLAVAALGACGALLHVWNHTVMKGLMFLGAGSVLHGAGSKNMARLGGLIQRMPHTGSLMVIGAVAIAGLPPLNGFVSEWLIYLGLMGGGSVSVNGGRVDTVILLAVGLLAVVGGLAALCFVRLVGIALLGEARGDESRHAHESSAWLTLPMAVLALTAIAISVLPHYVVDALRGVITQLFGAPVAQTLGMAMSSATAVGIMNGICWACLVAVGMMTALLLRRRAAPVETWGCGYAAPTARMQYTGSSFSELVTGHLLPAAIRARICRPTPVTPFPTQTTFTSDCADPLTQRLYEPFFFGWADRFARLRWMQQGALHIYVLYILATLLAALGWMYWRVRMGQ